MIQLTLKMVEIVAVFGTVSSAVYYLVCLWSAAGFLRERTLGKSTDSANNLPPISILKPLKGTDPEIYESLRSHCLQDYPEYEIVFGASDPGDPAIASVRQLQREFPDRAIELVICEKMLGANVKVSNLAQMSAVARHAHLIVNDSDIRVERDYLRRVITPLSDPNVGLVTCLYRGAAQRTLGSRLEALGIATDFCPSVLAARQVEGIHFGLGSTLAFRSAELEKIGGFTVLVDFLADDYELGKRIADLGMAVQLSDVVVETFLPAYSLREFFAHQLRWARGVRDSRGGGYAGLIVTFGLLWAVLAAIVSGGTPWAWGMLAGILAMRVAVALVVGGAVLGDRRVGKNLWMTPIRDLVAVAVWIASFAGHTVTWRGDRFRLRQGKLIRL